MTTDRQRRIDMEDARREAAARDGQVKFNERSNRRWRHIQAMRELNQQIYDAVNDRKSPRKAGVQ